MKVFFGLAISILAAFSVPACVSQINDENVGVSGQQSVGRSKKYSQFELDTAFRSDAREFSKFNDTSDNYGLCCILLDNDFIAIETVREHFKENIGDNIGDYGFVVEEDFRYYRIGLWPRYTTSIRTEVDGIWLPDTGADSVAGHVYLIDRNSHEIVDYRLSSN